MSVTRKPIEVFFSYSHKDEILRDELEKHLSILKRQGVIQNWHDRRIGAGREWEDEIDTHLNTAHVILLLISADFLASDYCYDIEMNRALERHDAGEARVIPVILRPVDWKGAPFAKLAALPTDAMPITHWTNRDAAFLDVARGIRAAVEELAQTVRPKKAPGLSSIWNVPYHRNLNFTGREDLLADLRAALMSGQPIAQIQAITGIGGVGKTQLAVEYAHRHAAEYDLVWWVRAEEPATLAADYAGLAEALDLPEKDVTDQSVVIHAVRHWLEQHGGWLLVFDNARDPAEVWPYIPWGATSHVLITSRNPNWGSMASLLPMKVLDREESIAFIIERTGEVDEETANALAEALGDLPLALEQAGAYVEATGQSLSRYLDLFRRHKWGLLSQGPLLKAYPHMVATTWEISFQQVRRALPAAADLLNLCAFLAPDDIPRELLSGGVQHLPEPLADIVADPLAFNEAIAALRLHSLIVMTRDSLSIQCLLQAVVRDRLPEAEQRTWAEVAVRLVNVAFPFDSDDVLTWPQCSRLLPHALAAAEHAEELGVALKTTARLLNQVGLYLSSRAEFAEAKAAFERALAINKAVFGFDHPEVATGLNNLGSVLQDLGDLAGAWEAYQRALAIRQKVLGGEHPDTAISLNNLGYLLKAMGDLAGARPYFERALAIDEAAFGPDHPKVAIRVNNLGSVLQDLDDLAGAGAAYERALAIWEQSLGPEHPNVASAVNNLGLVLQDLGDLAGARTTLERALAIDEAALGPDHPEVARGLNNLGMVLRDLGDLTGARAAFERALVIDETILGPDHPNIAIHVNNLGLVLQDAGDLLAARAAFERALRIFSKTLGEEHPFTNQVRENLPTGGGGSQ